MGLLDGLRIYRGKWNVKSIDDFTQSDIASVSSATVVASEFGNSVCLMLHAGGMKFLPVSTDSRKGVKVGDSVDLSKCQRITLGREGDADIYRIRIN